MPERMIDIVHAGSASRDLTEDDPRGWRLGGGASYSALTTARLGLHTAAVIGVDRAAASAPELILLRDAGVELLLVELDEGPVFRNLESPNGRVQMCLSPGHHLPIPGVPASWNQAHFWSLVPVAGELGDEWVSVVQGDSFLGLGWQGLLRNLVAGREVTRKAPTRSPLLERADLVGVSRHDLEPGTALASLSRLLRPTADLVVTDGPAGGRLVRLGSDGRARTQRYAAVAPSREVDATGAGDVFLAALVASLVGQGKEGRAAVPRRRLDLRFAAAAASFVVEAPGLNGVPDRRAILRRIARDRPASSAAG